MGVGVRLCSAVELSGGSELWEGLGQGAKRSELRLPESGLIDRGVGAGVEQESRSSERLGLVPVMGL